MADLKTVTPVLVPVASVAQHALVPDDAAPYRTVLVPAGQLIEVIIHVAGKPFATVGTWTAAPLVGKNAAVEVRARVFNGCTISKFPKPVALEEPV